MISEGAIRRLLTRFEVFPPFVDVLRTFGQRTSLEDDSYGTVHFQKNKQYESFGKS